MVKLVMASGDQATTFIVLASIVIPLVALGWLCWFFWVHRHED